ncbi:DNA replication complex GINS protein PSF3 [Pseudozyma hubeiensis]|nr:DNA replication complex GINS protein PSF3 [Pseudozyma hubeiensis]
MDVADSGADNTSAPWSWRLDSHAATSSSLGPSASASFVSTDPLASLSKATVAASSDEISWQNFRLSGKETTRKDRKRQRLHRFDSDQDEEDGADRTIRVKQEGENVMNARIADVESEEDDAAGLGDSSSEESDALGDEKGEDIRSASQVKVEGSTDSSASVHRKRGRPRRTQVESSTSSVHTIAKAIHKRIAHSSDGHMDAVSSTGDESPTPLTYKETVRLVRLISMIFRFPKSSRRIVRRRSRFDQDHTLSASSSTSPASTSASITSEASTSTHQALPPHLPPPRSTTQKPRILAKIHPDDASPDSPAVLKLIALIPAALPARIDCADWIVDLAVKARRDEYGNVFLPNSAYASVKDEEMDGSAEAERSDSVDVVGGRGVKGENVKVTRLVRQRLGREAPSIPLPGFWKRRGEGERVKVEGVDDTGTVKGEQEVSMFGVEGQGQLPGREKDQVHAVIRPPADSDPTIIPTLPPATFISEQETSSQPPSSSPPPSSGHTTSSRASGRRTVNLSKVLAERMREKRQAKTLLLRTHQSLRKRKSSESEDAQKDADEDHEDEDMGVDDETLRNTIANRRVSGAMIGGEGSKLGDKPNESLVQDDPDALKVKEEEMEVSAS